MTSVPSARATMRSPESAVICLRSRENAIRVPSCEYHGPRSCLGAGEDRHGRWHRSRRRSRCRRHRNRRASRCGRDRRAPAGPPGGPRRRDHGRAGRARTRARVRAMMEASRSVGEPTATREEMRMGGSLMRASQRGRGRAAARGGERCRVAAGPGRATGPTSASTSSSRRSKRTSSFMPFAPGPAGAWPPARRASRRAGPARPRWSRDLAVPTGMSRMPAASVSGRSR